jgi:hypothetical protein
MKSLIDIMHLPLNASEIKAVAVTSYALETENSSAVKSLNEEEKLFGKNILNFIKIFNDTELETITSPTTKI